VKWVFWDIPTHAEWSVRYLQAHATAAKKAIEVRKLAGDEHEGTPDSKEEHGEAPHIFLNDKTDSDDSIESFVSADSYHTTDPTDIISFRCLYTIYPGRLILSTTGIRFRSSFSKLSNSEVKFDFQYVQLREMSKSQAKKGLLSPVAKYTSGLDKLELIFNDEHGEQIVLLENMRGRDRAFNAILGFSGLEWQNLQTCKKLQGPVNTK